MSHIDIRKPHNLGKTEARAAADEVARELTEEFAVTCEWQGDQLHFERAGVNGVLEVSEHDVALKAELSFLLLPLKTKIEQEVHRYLDQSFDTVA